MVRATGPGEFEDSPQSVGYGADRYAGYPTREEAQPMTPTQLKPCCKCGGDAQRCLSSDGDVEWFQCRRCGYESPCKYSYHEAIAAWNQRTTPTQEDEALPEPMGHDEAIDALRGCAATVTVLSYQEAIEGYFTLRGLKIP